MNTAYQGNNDLCFDTGVFETVAANLRNDATELQTILTDLTDAVETLKDDWKSKASDTFFELVSDEWANDLSRYADLVDTLAEILEFAATTYGDLETAATQLEFDPTAEG
ncbi:MAG: WXG100 family type VII secretion target [Lachnospiraceae bacterium]|nr:WXG100 family type VII secretion target [Lachnospiraceae bacterium]MBP3506770.1 WXG100 family type VII secretion target [Lachnospiraceae bacterium]